MKRDNIYIYPLEGKIIFPYHQYRFTINSNVYNSQHYDNLVGFVTKIGDIKDYEDIDRIDQISRYGTLLRIQKSDMLAGYQIHQMEKVFSVNYLGLSISRFKILSMTKVDGKALASIQILTDELTKETQSSLQNKNLISKLKKELKTYYECKHRSQQADARKDQLENETSINKLIFKAIDEIEISYIQKVKFIQLHNHQQRIEALIGYLTSKTKNMKGIIDLEDQVKRNLYKSEVKRRMPIMAMDPRGQHNDNTELMDKINSKKLPKHVKVEIDKELKRMNGQTQSSVSEKYIETLLQIPWLDSTEEHKDMSTAERILNDDHTGLKDVKERILEFLAVKFRKGNSKGNIICLHGPPGVGKTSIAKSIAKALGRQFTRVSLGGMNDEAQLRGHRRTYVSALPGVIIRALIKAKSNNPVILLDEIQKIGHSQKGNPQHALLEILDPSQNSSFVDHYIGIPVDLSKVMFICTANSLELSGPLINRLELIQVPGYSRQEKFEIAKNHIIPIQIKENGVQGLIEFQYEGLKEIIKHSTEMGVRDLQRKIAKVCRKVARSGVKQIISKEKAEEYLGKRYKNELWQGIGVVNGMAWTQMGGKVLTVEAVQYHSRQQKIEVTGQLGDVMKESVNIAFSWFKSNLDELAVVGNSHQHMTNPEKVQYLDETSLHIHFPEGATKKDGPSAGVTIVTCIASLFLKAPVRSNLSMTGEITLSGKVLPVGGVRQKCIAAIYEGMKHIIIPFDNMKDLDKIDYELRKNVQFYPVRDIKEVLTVAFPGLVERSMPKL